MMKKFLILMLLLTACTPDLSRIPPRQTPSDSSFPVTSPSVQHSRVPLPRPEHAKKLIFIVDVDLDSRWHLSEVVAEWNKAKNTRFIIADDGCPVTIACVVIFEDDLKYPHLGETAFGYTQNDNEIQLDPEALKAGLAQSVMCHELGHILGLGHLKGTRNTCMKAALDGPGKDRKLPSAIDLKWADSLGKWELEKMWKLSAKDVDVRNLH